MSYCRRFLRITAGSRTQCRRLSSGTAGTATQHCRQFLKITAGTSVLPDGSAINGWYGVTTGLTTGLFTVRSGGASSSSHRRRRRRLLLPPVATQCWRLSSGITSTATPQCRRFVRITAGTSVFPGKGKKRKENGKTIFYMKKSETPFGNIVFKERCTYVPSMGTL